MSLITQCPACATMFKVVPDQLRISDGWVRCGQCDEVFDANAHLQSSTSESGLAPSRVKVEQVSVPSARQEVPSDGGAIQHTAFLNASDEPVADPSVDASLSEPPSFPEPSLDVLEEPEPEDIFFDNGDVPGDVEFVISSRIPLSLDDAPHTQRSGVDPQLSFMRGDGVRSKRSTPVVRSILVVLSVLFGGLLMLQVVIQERDRLAAGEPAVRQVLESVCATLACQIAPLRQIEAIVIDSSSFTKVRADVYRLSFTLKNTAAMDIATPALELTLTDLQDQAVVRRVIERSHFGSKQGVLAHGEELTASLLMSVRMPGSSERVSGYRLLAFYP
jgi:predicted Zn finger-like uncharacterized protein